VKDVCDHIILFSILVCVCVIHHLAARNEQRRLEEQHSFLQRVQRPFLYPCQTRRQDKTRQDKTRHDKTRQINTISFQHNKKCISHLTYIIEKRKSSDTTHKRENEDRAGGGWVLVSLVSLIALTLIALQATLSLGSEENVLVRMHQGSGRQSGRQTGHDVSFSALERHV
jgi:hypothetical protein